jgi:hypothetical protein
MRFGCGCFLLMVLLAVMVAAMAWGAWQSIQPAELPALRVTAADGQRAQQKLYAAANRARGGESIALTEAEINAFLVRNIRQIGDAPLSEFRVRLPGRGTIEIAASTPLGALLQDDPTLGRARDVLPARWLGWPVWVHVTATPRVERIDGRRANLRLDVQQFRLGRQRLPALAARLLLDPSMTRLLRLPLPDGVETVSAEAGRVVIRFAG